MIAIDPLLGFSVQVGQALGLKTTAPQSPWLNVNGYPPPGPGLGNANPNAKPSEGIGLPPDESRANALPIRVIPIGMAGPIQQAGPETQVREGHHVPVDVALQELPSLGNLGLCAMHVLS